MAENVCEAYVLLAELLMARGAPLPLSDHPGVYEMQIDQRWKVVVNGHHEPVKYDCIEIEPFHVVAEYNGWPAGIFGPGGGCIAAGECANESTFIEAIKAAMPNQGTCAP
jgi:hypothetical protein